MSLWHRALLILITLPIALAFGGCSRSGGKGNQPLATAVIELANEPSTTFKVTYQPNLVQVDHGSVAQSIVAISPDGSTFVFNRAPASILKAMPGTTVLLAGLALRKISSVHTNGGFALVQTAPATLADAIQDGTITWGHTITFGGQIFQARQMQLATALYSDALAALLEANPQPALADAGAPITVSHTGTLNEWQYTTQTTVGNNQLTIDETLTREAEGGMKLNMHAKGTISNFNSSADIEIKNGQIVKFTYLNKNVTGTIDFEWTATKSGPGPGGLPKTERLVTIPPLVSIPLDLQGLPFTLNIESAMLVEPAFSGANEMTRGHFTVNFSGDQGFSVVNGATKEAGAMQSTLTIAPDTTSLSPIAASAFVGALALPKFELKSGIAPESLQPGNGAFADQAKQLLAQSGYASALTNPTGLPPNGSYTQLIISSGSMNFGVMDSLIPCQQTTAELSLKVGNAASLGVPSNDPNANYKLGTQHLINPAVQYCATRGLLAGAGSGSPAPKSTTTGSCDLSATGNASDFYGVQGGTVMQAFLAGGKHPGIDITHLRDDPVFVNLRVEVPLSEFNSARLLSTKEMTGLGVPGTGVARLMDATVIIQPWYPGCPSSHSCTNPTTDDSYGGIVGLAAHYQFGQNQILTIYVEYEHLISQAYQPRKDDGTYINNQGQTIGQGTYVTQQLGCVGFGTTMANGTTLNVDRLDDHPLIGYLGATQSPHVHIQTAFALGRQGYLHSNFFDPGIVLVR
jgi:hypothetical protein